MTNHNDQRSSWDLAIVGAGVSGSTLAYELARRGHSVVVLERGKSLRSDPRVVRGEPEARHEPRGYLTMKTRPCASSLRGYSEISTRN